MRASRDGFLDKERDTGEMLEELHLDISPWFGAASEHGRAADDDRMGPMLQIFGVEGGDVVVERLEDGGVFVGGDDEGVAFLLEDCLGAFDCGVDDGYYFEAAA